MRSSSSWYAGMLIAGFLLAGRAHADCTPGETRCGADSNVERCNADHTWDTDPGAICNRNIPNRPEDDRRGDRRIDGGGSLAGDVCTSGISRCGADNHVERCTDANTWETDPGSTCTR